MQKLRAIVGYALTLGALALQGYLLTKTDAATAKD